MSSLPLFPDSPAASRARLAIRVAVGYSILLHALVMLAPLRDKLPMPPPGGVSGPMQVRIERTPAPATPVVETAERKPVPPVRTALARRVPLAMPPRDLPTPPVNAVPAAQPDPVREPAREPSFDMSALIAANRERRRAWESAAARSPSGADGASSDPAADNLARNLASLSRGDGTGGIFQILRVGARTGEFSFNGWRTESRKKWREVIEVDAGSGGDVERAIVRRMIELIRGHYTGDFSWESSRSGHVVVLSAAPADNDQLEDYLMREFFGVPAVRTRRPGR
ncbi:MAG: hypothetical protein IPP91_07050 [Betaproteobacteria bacterium]|nr:hypothetical protein [Betaproteobacteria bacterium]